MELVLARMYFGNKATIGQLEKGVEQDSVSTLQRICYTLEDFDRGDDMSKKVFGETAIPAGRYEILITPSPAFNDQMMPLLIGVPNFTGVRIHWGNNHKNTKGCPLVGLDKDLNKWTLGRSMEAYKILFPMLQQEQLQGKKNFITIIRRPQ
jgi:hypothetical protein